MTKHLARMYLFLLTVLGDIVHSDGEGVTSGKESMSAIEGGQLVPLNGWLGSRKRTGSQASK